MFDNNVSRARQGRTLFSGMYEFGLVVSIHGSYSTSLTASRQANEQNKMKDSQGSTLIEGILSHQGSVHCFIFGFEAGIHLKFALPPATLVNLAFILP